MHIRLFNLSPEIQFKAKKSNHFLHFTLFFWPTPTYNLFIILHFLLAFLFKSQIKFSSCLSFLLPFLLCYLYPILVPFYTFPNCFSVFTHLRHACISFLSNYISKKININIPKNLVHFVFASFYSTYFTTNTFYTI